MISFLLTYHFVVELATLVLCVVSGNIESSSVDTHTADTHTADTQIQWLVYLKIHRLIEDQSYCYEFCNLYQGCWKYSKIVEWGRNFSEKFDEWKKQYAIVKIVCIFLLLIQVVLRNVRVYYLQKKTGRLVSARPDCSHLIYSFTFGQPGLS